MEVAGRQTGKISFTRTGVPMCYQSRSSDRLIVYSMICLPSEQHRALGEVSKSGWLPLGLAGIKPVPDPSLFT